MLYRTKLSAAARKTLMLRRRVGDARIFYLCCLSVTFPLPRARKWNHPTAVKVANEMNLEVNKFEEQGKRSGLRADMTSVIPPLVQAERRMEKLVDLGGGWISRPAFTIF